MNKNLLTLAVAAALAAPAIASAEAIIYGKVHVSLDYEEIDNMIRPVYNNSARAAGQTINGVAVPAYAGDDIFVGPDGQISGIRVPTGTALTQAQSDALRGFARVAPDQLAPGVNFKGWGMSKNTGFQGAGRASRVGVKGSEDLGNGLKAVYQVEIGVELNDTNSNPVNNNDNIYYRNTFVGLAGDWGTALMGRHDTPLKISTGKLDLFSDTMADYNNTIGFQDLRADNAIAYISPSWSGFQLAAAIVPSGMGTAIGTDNRNINSDGIDGAYSLAGIYKNGPFYASVAYESINEEMFMTQATSLNGCYPTVVNLGALGTQTTYNCAKPSGDFNKWRVGLGLLDWNGFTLAAIYENQEDLPSTTNSVMFSDPTLAPLSYNLPGGPDKRDLWQIQAGYGFGNFMVKAMYGQTEFSGDASIPNLANFGQTTSNMRMYQSMGEDLYDGTTSSWAVGLDYNFSKRTQAYILYTATSSDQGDIPVLSNNLAGGVAAVGGASAVLNSASRVSEWDGFSIGMMHSF